MEDTSRATIEKLLAGHKSFFNSLQSRDLDFRIAQLKKFKDAVVRYEKEILDALKADLHKSAEEAYLTEISIVRQEIDYHLKNIRKWSKPKRVKTPLHLLPSRSKIYYEPLGTALIIAPWNYPFQLLLNPLVGAISSGCCAMLKPSPYTPTVAGVIQKMVNEVFDESYISIVQGGRNVNTILLEQRFDVIFFTGSPSLGKIVMKAASAHLTPVVLELGGKSPCIVDTDANIDIAARRIAWGKTINAGQTCIAPDYLMVHKDVKDALLEKIKFYITQWHGEDASKSPYFPRIVNHQAMERLQKLMQHGKILFGGNLDMESRYISPTIIDNISPDDPIMQEEIFGPLLPVMTFEHINEVVAYVTSHEKPLALYFFGKNKQAKDMLVRTSSGGACINDTLLHVATHHLPFGGVGNSGMNKYHGHGTFLAYCNAKAVLISSNSFDLKMKYPPFKNFNVIKRFLG